MGLIKRSNSVFALRLAKVAAKCADRNERQAA